MRIVLGFHALFISVLVLAAIDTRWAFLPDWGLYAGFAAIVVYLLAWFAYEIYSSISPLNRPRASRD